MKITNETHYLTLDVRRIIARAFRESDILPAESKSVRVEVVYGHRHRYSGRASIGVKVWDIEARQLKRRLASWMRLRLPKEGAKPADFAAVVLHEIAHLKGRKHPNFEPALMHCYPSIAPWANDMPLGLKPKAVKRDGGPDAYLEKCRDRAVQLERKIRRLTKLRAKYVTRVKNMERRRAQESVATAAGIAGTINAAP